MTTITNCLEHGEVIPLHNGTCPWCPDGSTKSTKPTPDEYEPGRYYSIQRALEATLLFHLAGYEP